MINKNRFVTQLKFNLVIPILFVLFSKCSFSQTIVGLRYGLNLATIQSAPNLQYRILRPGVIQSLSLDRLIKKKFVVGIELLINQLGNNSYQTNTDGSISTVSYSLDYMGIPIKIGYRSQTKKYFIVNIAACPSYLLGSNLHMYDNATAKKVELINPKKYNMAAFIESGIGFTTSDNFSINIIGTYFHSFDTGIYSHRAFCLSLGIAYSMQKNISKSHF